MKMGYCKGVALVTQCISTCQTKMSKLTPYWPWNKAYKLPSGSSKTKRFGYKGEWANV